MKSSSHCRSDAIQKTSLIIDDEPMIRMSLKKLFEKEGFTVSTASSGAAALKFMEAESPEIVVLDVRLPDCSGIELLRTIKKVTPETLVIMITGHADIKSSVEAMKIGARDFLEKPLDFHYINSILQGLKNQKAKNFATGDFVYQSAKMRETVRIADTLAAKSDITVLVLGESGTGKNMLCRRIHELSARRELPLIEIGCSNIPDHLMESELFGYKKGAFTDAKDSKKGLFELAHGGTVMLDEIGDMPYQMQSKILTLMEEKKFRSIGGLDFIHTDVRILAATNRDLPELVQAKQFRLDLFYRLNVATIEIPPLRTRKEDLPFLIRNYLEKSCRKYGIGLKGFSDAAMRCLEEYDWPGNVRELKNLIERVVILARGEDIVEDDVQPCLVRGKAPSCTVDPSQKKPPGCRSLKAVEEEMIKAALEATKGNQRKTANLLEISRDTLRYRLKKMGLAPRRVEADEES